MEEIIKLSVTDIGVLHISLNRPDQLNALSQELIQHLSRVFSQAKHDKSIKAVLLTGEGKGFCAGADIKQLAELNGQSGLQFARFAQSVFRQLEILGKPSLAAIHGFAFGGGCELAMAATLRIATQNAVFGQPEIKLGVMPGFGGTQRLPAYIGKGRAMEVCLTGRRFSAEEAFQWGLVNELTDQENLLSRAHSLLHTLLQFSPIALQSIMTSIEQGQALPLEAGQEIEAAQFAICCTSADKSEGVNAFLEKRSATFTGE